MKISTKAASFLSSIKTQTYDKKEREMIITYQQKRVFHLSLLMLVLQQYLQPIITQYFIDNKSEIWLLFLIAHSKR